NCPSGISLVSVSVKFSHFAQQIAEIPVCLGIFRLKSDRVAIGRDRLIELPDFAMSVAQVVKSLGKIRPKLHRPPARRDRLIELSLPAQRIPEVAVILRTRRFERDRPA